MKLFDLANETLKDREQFYGKTFDCHASIARMWQEYLRLKGKNHVLSVTDVAMMMTIFKIVREAITHKPDNLVDAASYLAFAFEFENGSINIKTELGPIMDTLKNGKGWHKKPEELYHRFAGEVLVSKDGNQYCVTRKNFVNLQESIAGFEDTVESAVLNLCEQESAKTKSNPYASLIYWVSDSKWICSTDKQAMPQGVGVSPWQASQDYLRKLNDSTSIQDVAKSQLSESNSPTTTIRDCGRSGGTGSVNIEDSTEHPGPQF